MKNLFLILSLILLCCKGTLGQGLQGKVHSEDGPFEGNISVYIAGKVLTATSDKQGQYTLPLEDTGLLIIRINSAEYNNYTDSIRIPAKKKYTQKDILLVSGIKYLKEVTINKLLAVTQNDDTLTYNADAYKVNPDADVSDLVRKMPSLEINGQEIKFQGEQVTKVLVDGKPFFGENPYTALKTLPANVVKSIRAYEEKSEQDQFTGFREGAVGKTINIITKAGVSKSLFGSISAGYGKDNNDIGVYSTELSLNKFSGDKRLSLTARKNNVNLPNFNTPNMAGMGSSAGGIQHTQSAGINISDKIGKKSDLALSYFYSNFNNKIDTRLSRTYFTQSTTGQVYSEQNGTHSGVNNHNADMRLNLYLDSLTSILVQPRINITQSDNLRATEGNTLQNANPLNNTRNRTNAEQNNFSFSNSLLFKRRFAKKGRTFSANFLTNYAQNRNETRLNATNTYFANPGSDTIDQYSIQSLHAPNLSADLNYTEPAGKNGLLKLLLQATANPSESIRETSNFSDTTNSYSIPDSALSSTLRSKKNAHKIGASYLYQFDKTEWSLSANYQYNRLHNDQYPVPSIPESQVFKNLIASTYLQYKFSKQQYLRADYSAQTQTPTTTQLQDVVNNTNPLHLKTGNPALKQSLRHQLGFRYNSVNAARSSNLSTSFTASLVQNSIGSNTIIAGNDSIVKGGLLLPAGSMITVPVNLKGFYTLSLYANYGGALPAIKCNFNINLSMTQNGNPGMVNNQVSNQTSRNIGLKGQLSSNINEKIDFSLQAASTLINNMNSLNSNLSRTYQKNEFAGSLNLRLPGKFILNTAFNAQSNSGLRDAFNQNFFLLNLSIGKKFLKHQKGDIRITAFDVLNNNTNVSYSANSEYEEITQSTILQRYFMLVFSYKIQNIK